MLQVQQALHRLKMVRCRAAFVDSFCRQSAFKLTEDRVEPVVMDGLTSSMRMLAFKLTPGI